MKLPWGTGTISNILTIRNLGLTRMMVCFSLEVSRTESKRLEEANVLPNSAVTAIMAAVPWFQRLKTIFLMGFNFIKILFPGAKRRNPPPRFTRIHCAVVLSFPIVFRASPFVHGSGIGEEILAHEVQWKDCSSLTLSNFRMAPDRKASQDENA